LVIVVVVVIVALGFVVCGGFGILFVLVGDGGDKSLVCLDIMVLVVFGGGWDGIAWVMGVFIEFVEFVKFVIVKNVVGVGGIVGFAQFANDKSDYLLMVMGFVMVGVVVMN